MSLEAGRAQTPPKQTRIKTKPTTPNSIYTAEGSFGACDWESWWQRRSCRPPGRPYPADTRNPWRNPTSS